jgi:hypothetical protein
MEVEAVADDPSQQHAEPAVEDKEGDVLEQTGHRST